MADASNLLLAAHNVEYDEAARDTVCTCGEKTGRNGYLAHISGLLGTDECGARKSLLKAHSFTEINPGMCGGCDTCGSDSAAALCAICGEGYSPCAAYFIATLNEDGTRFEFPSTEGSA